MTHITRRANAFNFIELYQSGQSLAKFKINDDKAKRLAEAIKNHEVTSRSTHLDLANNRITQKGAEALLETCALRSISFYSNNIIHINRNVLQAAQITFLNLSYNPLDDNAVQELCLSTTLTSINISGITHSASSLRELARCRSLRILTLDSCKITNEGVDFLSRSASLTSLSLRSNEFNATGVAPLVQITTLTSLDLSLNGLKDDITGPLTQMTSLTSLRLDSNKLTSEGATPLLRLPSLNSLFLASNNLATVTNFLKCKTLLVLDISDSLKPLGCTPIRDLLKYNHNLTDLRVSDPDELHTDIPAIMRKREIALHNWKLVCVLFASYRANRDSPIRDSILSLMADIRPLLSTL